MKARSALIAVLLFAAVLFWWGRAGGNDSPNVQPSETNVTYTKEELETEMWRTYAALKQHGIRVYSWSASLHDNAVKIVVDPRDREKLAVTQEGVPKKHYYRLLRENDPAPVYVMFEGPYTNLGN